MRMTFILFSLIICWVGDASLMIYADQPQKEDDNKHLFIYLFVKSFLCMIQNGIERTFQPQTFTNQITCS
jgi:hypothetical protein